MKRVGIQMGIFVLSVTFLAFYYVYLHWSWRTEEVLNRAQISRMLCALKYDDETCESLMMDLNIDELPEDVALQSWYAKYIGIALNEQWMQVDESGCFKPGAAFTYGDLSDLLNKFYLTEDMLSFSIKHRQLDAMVAKKHWFEVFDLLCVNQNRVRKVQRKIYASSSVNKELAAWEVDTDDGIKMAIGISIDAYLNQVVEVYEKDNQILCVIRTISEEYSTDNYMEQTNETPESKYLSDQMIRVLLQSEDLDYDHEQVAITSDEKFYVKNGRTVERYNAGEVYEIYKSDLTNSPMTIETESSIGELNVLSIERACGTPRYKGKIELQEGTDGIWMINEVDMETYVAGVVSSEMPDSYGLEALKAQAVCVRTYGLKAMQEGFEAYPSDVDDTVATQVYNNQGMNDSSLKAAYDTKGQVLKNSEGISNVYFFSTSCGHTSRSEDVWYNGTENLEDESITVFLSDESVILNLKDEKDFRAFINLEYDSSYYEEDLPWFRWQVFISDTVIEEKLRDVMRVDIGDLVHVNIIERAESGLIKTIIFEGDQASCTVFGEYRIRQIFSPENVDIKLKDGNIVQGGSLLPSGYFYIDTLYEDQLNKGCMIFGGGYGHGCGMSQNGAMKMAETGKTYEEILECFFPDSEIFNVPVDFSTNEE